MRILVNENVPRSAVAEQRVLFTFDKDFGALAYRQRLPGGFGTRTASARAKQ